MNRRLWIPFLGIIIAVSALVSGRISADPESGFILSGYQNADAKFLGDRIITSVDEGIVILDMEGQTLKSYPDLTASWLYAQDDGNGGYAAAYSNHDNGTHIARLTADGDLIEDRTVIRTDTLAIDPILVRTDDGWLLTHTWIEGTINNPDPQGENGTYTVKLYRSRDLTKWEYVTDIISRKQNLEDGDIRIADGVLYYFFEMEEYDKGPSQICVMMSADEGENWSEPLPLTDVEADNEMASCERTDDGWRLYVSSDYENPGASYQGAKVYYEDFSADFSRRSGYRLSAMPDNEAVRLYEVRQTEDKIYFLFARNFLTDCDLLLRTIDKED